MRLKAKGMPKYGNQSSYKDMLVKLNVVLPKNLTEQEESFFKQLKELQMQKKDKAYGV